MQGATRISIDSTVTGTLFNRDAVSGFISPQKLTTNFVHITVVCCIGKANLV